MSKNSMILVTGAGGQLGRRLVRRLVAEGYNVRAHYRSGEKAKRLCPNGVNFVLGDLLETSWLTRAAIGCDYVIHSAARVSVRPLNSADTEYMYRVNVEGTRLVVEACREAGVKRLIYISSVAAVGASSDDTPIDETAPFNLAKYNLPYFGTKHEAEQIALAANGNDLEVIALAPSIMISIPDRPMTERDLKKIPKRIPVYFDFGLNLVETEDVIEAIISAIDKGTPGHRYILAGDNIDPAKAFAIAGKYFGIKKPFIKIPYWMLYLTGAVMELIYVFRNKKPRFNRAIAHLAKLKFYYNCAKAKRELGFSPKTLDQSVARIVEKLNINI